MIRLGVVNFLNALPLWDALQDDASVEVIPAMPSQLARMLKEGEIDAGLLPVIEFFRNKETKLVAGPCVAADGPVESVLLFHRKPLAEIEHLTLDANSRSSNALAQVLCADLWKIAPKFELPEESVNDLAQAKSDALVMIGDPAMVAARKPLDWEVCDLAEAWQRHTGLPALFAGWLTRKDAALPLEVLEKALEIGLSRRSFYAKEFSKRLASSEQELERYLTSVIRYQWGDDLKETLTRFGDKASCLGLCESRPVELLES